MKRFMMFGLCLVILLALVSCRRKSSEITFDTISQDIYINYWKDTPAIIVIAQSKDVDEAAKGVLLERPELLKDLYKLNYDDAFAILVLRGQENITGYSITVQQVIQQGDQMRVLAETKDPVQNTRIQPTLTSPYHLIKLSRSKTLSGEIAFSLEIGGSIVAKTTHTLP